MKEAGVTVEATKNRKGLVGFRFRTQWLPDASFKGSELGKSFIPGTGFVSRG